jgi:hypothetical protein
MTSIAAESEKGPSMADIFLKHQPILFEVKFGDGESYEMFVPSFSFLVTDYVFLVSRSAPYSFFEKALLPFDSEVWYWLIGFLAVGLLVIVAVSFMSQKIRNFVFGLGIRAPMLNLV